MKSIAGRWVTAAGVFVFLSAFSLGENESQKAEFMESLRRDIVKVDHSIDVTRDLIKKSKGAQFLPDIVFRLAELFIEKSRLVYYLAVEEKGADAATSPESKLLKNEAIKVYKDIMHRFPEYRYNDKVLFFTGHEYLELGMHEEMLESYKKLIEEYPKSNLMLEALYIVGDYYFNRDDLDNAEKHYLRLLEFRESPLHDMARYKLGWIAINRARLDKKYWRKAIELFEQVARSANSPDEGISVDTHKMVNIKLEALAGIVFCFTEVHSPKIALDYFRKLSPSKIVYVQGLEKLANRYFIKEQYDNAALIYRRIIELSNDVEKNLDYGQRIYDSSSFSKSKDKVDEDVAALVKAASKYAYSWRIAEEEKKQLAKEFEVYARDIVTKLHLLAQKQQEKRAYRIAAKAYKYYLSFFDYSDKIDEVRFNYAESLFNSDQFLEAARVYEDNTRRMQESKERRDVLYSTLQSFQRALGEVKYLSRFGLVEARQGLKQLGAYFVKKYPQDDKTPTIKFNVARMFYDQGQFKEAIESFLEYIKQYPADKEAATAGHLVLDCYKQLEDFEGLAKQGQAFLADASIKDEKFKGEVKGIIETAQANKIDKMTLVASAEGGDVVKKLLDAVEGTDDQVEAENVVYRAFVVAKEKRDIEMAFKAGGKLAQQYKQSKYLQDVYGTLGNFSVQMADFERAANLYEDYFGKFPGSPEAAELLKAAGNLYAYLGSYKDAIRVYRTLLEKASGSRKGEFLVELADAYAKQDDWRMVQEVGKQAAAERGSAKALLLYGKALEKSGNSDGAKQAYMNAAGSASGTQDATFAAEGQFRLGEMLLEDFNGIRFGAGQPDNTVVQNKLQMLGTLDQVFAGVVQLKDPAWAIAALFRLWDTYSKFGEFLASAPVPADLNAEQKKQYAQMIAEQVKGQRESAKAYLDACVKTVSEKKVFGPYALACITKVPPVSADKIRRRGGGRAQGPQVDALKAKLLKSPSDLQTLDDLALIAIKSSDLYMARMVLSKALEVKETHAASLVLMGLVSLLMGDDQDGYDFLKKAMDAEPQNLAARLNMAGLFWTYKDEARARAVLSNVMGQVKTADLSGANLHPWVKDALTELRIR